MRHLKYADIFLRESEASITYMEKERYVEGTDRWLSGHSLRSKDEII